ncbi:hypothetical protein GCM10023188_25290 [Pontibacter saemangeumensis]|uniref:PH domain-containing protein n=1 Tax=Pontibacter saemangeumensis TaxID=1084525 RepID=A0ABP8LQT8_9BACT
MRHDSHTYKTGKYFSAAGRAISWVGLAIGLMAVLNGASVGWVMVPVAIAVQLTYHMVEFDLQRQTYREGVQLLGMKFGKRLPLPGFDFLFLKNNNYSQLAESRATMTQFRSEMFDGYIKLADGTKLHLLQTKSKAPALQQLAAIAQELNTELRDLTEMKQ